MAWQLSLFEKVAAGWEIYSKSVNQDKQFVNAFVAEKHLCSASLSQKQAKLLADKAWKANSKGAAAMTEILKLF